MPDTSQKLFPITILQDLCNYPCFTETKMEVQGRWDKITKETTAKWRNESQSQVHQLPVSIYIFISYSPCTCKITDQSERIPASAHAPHPSPTGERGEEIKRWDSHRNPQCWVTEQNKGWPTAETQSSKMHNTKRNADQGHLGLHPGSLWH